LIACQQFFHGRLFALDPVECLFEALLDEPLAKSFHGSGPTRVCLGDALVSPIGTIGVCLEENLRASHLLPGSFQFLDYSLKLESFLLRQSNDIQLPHGTPPCATQCR
jgi:hypothetical protein